MKCLLPSTRKFYTLLDFIKKFESLVKFQCTSEGITIFSMSGCHSVFVDVKLHRIFFDEYECNDHEELHLDLSSIVNILKNFGDKDQLVLASTSDTCTLDIVGTDGSFSQYCIKQMCIESEEMHIPEIVENVTIQCSPIYFNGWKKKVLDVTKNKISLHPTEKSITISSKDTVNGKASTTVNVPGNDIKYLRFDNPGPIELGNKNLCTIFEMGKLSNSVDFGWANDMPVRFGVTFDEKSHLNVYMAPMIMDED